MHNADLQLDDLFLFDGYGSACKHPWIAKKNAQNIKAQYVQNIEPAHFVKAKYDEEKIDRLSFPCRRGGIRILFVENFLQSNDSSS